MVSETFIRDQIIELIHQGESVTIYTMHKKGGRQLAALTGFEQYKLMDRVASPGSLLAANKIARFAKATGIVLANLLSKNRTYYLRSLKFKTYGSFALNLNLFYLVHYVLTQKIKIIHAHYGPIGNQAAILKEIGLPVKVFTTFHGFDIRQGLTQLDKKPYSRLFTQANGIFSISDFNTQSLISMGLTKSKILDLPNGVNASNYNCKDRDWNAPLNFLSVGRLVADKDYANALNALAKLKKNRPELAWTYNIIGQGELASKLEQLVKDVGLQHQVSFLGALPSQLVAASYCKAQLFILSSKNEALPTVLLEAQASGLPCVATRVGNVPAMLADGGFLAAPEDSLALYNAIEKAVNARQDWPNIGAKLKKEVLLKHDITACTKRLISYYNTN